MKYKKHLLFAGLLLSLCSCRQNPSELKIRTKENLLGTIITISTYDARESVYNECFSKVSDIDERMSVNLPESEISRLNMVAGEEKVQVSEDTYKLVEKCKEFSGLSNGLFDISIGAVVEKWKVDGVFARLPSEEELRKAVSLVDYNKIELFSDNYIKLSEKGMAIDLGAAAKGFACDEAVAILKKNGIKQALLDFGGNIYVHGTKLDGSPWRVGIKNPLYDGEGYVCYIEATDKSVVTSGIYERFFTKNDINYHHIINPKTGSPANNGIISATIVSPSSAEADILSTSCFILGVEEAKKLLSTMPDCEGIFITEDKKIHVTSGLKPIITNPEFVIY